MTRDLVLGSAALALAAGYYALAAGIQASALSDTVGPQGLPKTYAILLGALALVLIVRSLRTGQGPSAIADPHSAVAAPSVFRAAGIIVIGVVYLAVIPWLGYVLSLAMLIAATTYYQGGGLSRRVGLVAAGGALFFWVLFVFFLGIPHPPGLWPSLF